MAGKTEQVKGRAEEAVGSLTGDETLESQGRTDRRAGEAKEAVGHAKDKVDEVVDKVKHTVDQAIDQARGPRDGK